MKQQIAARAPKESLQSKFTSFRLPSPLSRNAPKSFGHLSAKELGALKNQTAEDMKALLEQGGLEVAASFREVSQLVVSAESHRASSGCTVQQAWARASRDFGELSLARKSITMFLSYEPAEGDIERPQEHTFPSQPR
jgi:hypothetical protein